MMKTVSTLLLFLSIATPVIGQSLANPYSVTRDVVYKQATVIQNGERASKDLWMDIFLPEQKVDGGLPAVIFSYGGAFQRGNPREIYDIDGQQDTPGEEYCRRFASRGYACFTITYRMTPDHPVPSLEGYSEEQLDRTTVSLMMDRVNPVRADMELPPLNPESKADMKLLSDAVLAAAEDLRSALNFVRERANEFGVDEDKIVLGGFSAGAVTSWNVGHGLGEDAAGIFLLSGAPLVFQLEKAVSDGPSTVPILMFLAQTDLSGARISNPIMVQHFEKMGVDYEFAWVPGFGHFYPAGATSMSGDATRMSVDARIMRFLNRVTEN